jgi:hypothetical protein
MMVPTVVMTLLWYWRIDTDPSGFPWGHDLIVFSIAETFKGVFALESWAPYSLMIGLAVLVLICFAIGISIEKKNYVGFLLSGTAILTIVAIIGEHHILEFKYPYPRTWQFLFPMIFAAGYVVASEIGSHFSARLRTAAASVFAIAITSFHYSFYDTTGVYPWGHLVPVKSGIQSILREKQEPRVCYSRMYDTVLDYYDYLYGWTIVKDCDEETAEYVFHSNVMLNKLGELPKERILFHDDRYDTEIFRVKRREDSD